ncbi:hypothetical protein POKO110462_16035 [Pontibacter korlensis]|uniref:hypothetical protein n=1 Tax=Pontibacter korlensis TaxID=400092 RepID=UPI000AC9337D|nr:hypothetical protein [Pontibacter korlensis]
MKRIRLTTRDVKFFLLGAFTLYALEVAFNWEAHKDAFWEGVETAKADNGESVTSEK